MICALCSQSIAPGDVNLHHPVYRCDGGTVTQPTHTIAMCSFTAAAMTSPSGAGAAARFPRSAASGLSTSEASTRTRPTTSTASFIKRCTDTAHNRDGNSKPPQKGHSDESTLQALWRAHLSLGQSARLADLEVPGLRQAISGRAL